MERYALGLVPGPTPVAPETLAAWSRDYGSPDLEEEFFSLYRETAAALARLVGSREGTGVLMTGEGMAALWGALRSAIAPGDRVLAVSSGLFGRGLGEMAATCGASVEALAFPDDEVPAADVVAERIRSFRPTLVTAVHCETPSGTLLPLEAIGRAAQDAGALFCVDAVASAGGAPVDADRRGIDLCLLGSQKCLGVPPALAMVVVSPRAWEQIAAVGYEGYDALLPFRDTPRTGACPYTPCWQAVAALKAALDRLFDEGLDAVFARHERVGAFCRQGVKSLGLALFPRDDRFCSPTVTAVQVPEALPWEELNRRLRHEGMAVGGNWGALAGRVFRLGHMGLQADLGLMTRALALLEEALES